MVATIAWFIVTKYMCHKSLTKEVATEWDDSSSYFWGITSNALRHPWHKWWRICFVCRIHIPIFLFHYWTPECNVKQRLPLMEQELLTFQKPFVYPSCSWLCCLICRMCATIVCLCALFWLLYWQSIDLRYLIINMVYSNISRLSLMRMHTNCIKYTYWKVWIICQDSRISN